MTSELKRVFPVEFNQLNRYGFQIIPSVLTAVQCKQRISEIHDIFEGLRPPSDPLHFDRELKHTHTVQRMLRAEAYGMINNFGSGHFEPIWRVRENRLLVNVYKRLYGYENDCDNKTFQFLCSFQGLTYSPPIEFAMNPRREQLRRFRIDQGVFLPGRHVSVQGFQTLTKATINDDAMVVLAGSHLYHAEFIRLFRTQRRSCRRIMLQSREVKWFLDQPGVVEVVIVHSAGDLVLWDARTVYFYQTAIKGRRTPRPRIGVNVCMKPAWLSHIEPDGERVMFTEKQLHDIVRRRITFLLTNRTTSGDPHHGVAHGFLPSHGLPKYTTEMKLPAPRPLQGHSELSQRLAGLGILSSKEEIEVYNDLKAAGNGIRAPVRVQTEPEGKREPRPKRPRATQSLSPSDPDETASEEDQQAPPKRARHEQPVMVVEPDAVFQRLDQQHRVRPTAQSTMVIWAPLGSRSHQ